MPQEFDRLALDRRSPSGKVTGHRVPQAVHFALAVALAFGPAVAGSSIDAAEGFRRLNGAQIHRKMSGMELSDDVHWRDYFEPSGTLTSRSMGRRVVGKWWVENGELCVDRGKGDGGCYEVWTSETKVELRRPGLDVPIFNGILRPPTKRE